MPDFSPFAQAGNPKEAVLADTDCRTGRIFTKVKKIR
jgi:hypothetical protein